MNQSEILSSISRVTSLQELEEVRVRYLGRKGELSLALRELGAMSDADRRIKGPELQSLRTSLEEAIALKQTELENATELVNIDVTEPGSRVMPVGTMHPVSQMKYAIWDAFSELGFDIVETPEVESDFNNFQALNMPLNHPARDMQDTFYLDPKTLLRTHATSFQARYMQNRKPPFRAISTGKCYRRDNDMRHTPMFHQFDGIMVDEKVTMADLKGVLSLVMSKLLGASVDIRFRYSYFPFVEPGAEFDVSCSICGGKGCRTCKQTGWVEMGGCGMIHRNVLQGVGIDPEKYQGWAFGFGIERPLVIKHGIPDLRAFFENDLRFLNQF